jgi:threonine synthase
MSTISLLERYGRAPSGAHVSCLVCRACGHETPVEATNICERCFGPLEVRYDYEEVARRISRESIAAGPPSIWRYRDLLPVDLEETEPISLGEGFTPLIHARNLGAELGLRNLYLKNDTQNPTGSFKDRVVSVAATWAREHGLTTIACASTGNLANSVAAYAAHAGLRAVVVVPSDLEPAKMIGTSIFRPTIIAVEGSYDDVNRLCTELADCVDWGDRKSTRLNSSHEQ